MADKDNFKKVSDAPEKAGMIKMDELLAANRDTSRSSKRTKKKEREQPAAGISQSRLDLFFTESLISSL